MPALRITAGVTNATTNETLSLTSAFNTTGNAEQSGVISVGTSEETLSVSSDIGNAGACVLINRDSTNFIDVGFATGVYPIRLLATQPATIGLAPGTSTIYLKADTAACLLQFKIWEV